MISTGTISYAVAGVSMLCKTKPLSVDKTLPGHPDPESVTGRIITLEYPLCYVIGTYVVNAGQGLKTLSAKNTWNEHFTTYIRDLDKKKPVIWMGDLNVAPTEKGQIVSVSLSSSKISTRSEQCEEKLEQNARLHQRRNTSLS